MADQLLINVLTVTVPASGSVTVPHGLKSNGKNVAPKLVLPAGASTVSVGAITDTSITFNNSAAYPVTAKFRVERGVSIEVDAETLEPVVVGSGVAGGIFGTADALQPTRLDTVFTGFDAAAQIPVHSYAGGLDRIVIRADDGNWLAMAAGVKNRVASTDTGAFIALKYATGPVGGNSEASLHGGSVSGGVRGGDVTVDWNVFINPGLDNLGNNGQIYLYGNVQAFGIVYGKKEETPVAGTPIPFSGNVVFLYPAAPVNMNGTAPQIALPSTVGALLTLCNQGAGAITLTNAAGGQMKLRTSPLVINQFEAYDFIFDGTYWVQRG